MPANSPPPTPAAQVRRELTRAMQRDPGLRPLVDNLGYPPPRVHAPGFATLLRIIVSQQLSTAVAAAIWRRLERSCRGRVTARKVMNRSVAALRECGLSGQKVGYAHDLAAMLGRGELDLDGIGGVDSGAAIQTLIGVRGVGRWTAEIYLMFALGHRDIFPAGDLALRVAVQRYAALPQRISQQQAAEFAQRWSPHRSVVALLMWQYYGAATLQ